MNVYHRLLLLTIYFIFRGSKLRVFIEVTKQVVLEIYLHKLLLFDPIRKYVHQKSAQTFTNKLRL